ncbi:hypothetical protein Q5424_22450 [Conexibacter sp. JD483]|uniref:hypothetical protein n=1 Tax=unclassified Conexibacter TaxID=2627773 RepID=UPI0027245078|nr:MULTISPECIES: hypothetical protein [unclassified Conexibacter]MDO8186091.1 hypothetical protein [Conexibacter sp. CPCC 205706]MDO8199581.1 hypothetical protein [Conexibacter sp. CPCC 205762]MDR9371876.1 hypothetical protein [Conexibacter sp. JD483]
MRRSALAATVAALAGALLLPAAAVADEAAAPATTVSCAQQPYPYEELATAEAGLAAFMNAPGSPYFGAYGIGCAPDGAMRLLVTIYDPTTAADERALRAFLAPAGDRVAITREHGGEIMVQGVIAHSAPAHAAGRARLAARPRRVGGTVRVRLACPERAARACGGRMLVHLTSRGGGTGTSGSTPRLLAARSFAHLAPGERRTLLFRLTSRQRADVRSGDVLSARVR